MASASVAGRRRVPFITPFTVGLMLCAGLASAAGPKLWLYPDTDSPRQGGHVVEPGTFTLYVENRGGGGNADSTAYGVQLVVAVADPGAVSTLEVATAAIDPAGEAFGTPPLPCSDRPMPRHGVYPAAYTLVDLGDLAAGNRFELEVSATGSDGLEVHFDALATGMRTTGQGTRCYDVVNPSGHDVTVADRPGGGNDHCGRVRMRKTADPRQLDVGGQLDFTITILNDGDCDLTDAVLIDLLPVVTDDAGAEFPVFEVLHVEPAPSSIDGTTIEWQLGSIPSDGTEVTVHIQVEVIEPLADGSRVVNRACLTAAELDRRVCASERVVIGDPIGGDGIGSPGFWCHAIRFALDDRPHAPYDVEQLALWLSEIDSQSSVFSELSDISTIERAGTVLCRPNQADGAAGRLLRHLLTLWLNVVSGKLDPATTLAELCEGNEAFPDGSDLDMTVEELIETVETAIVDGADNDELGFWSEVVDALNNALLPGELGCSAPRHGGRRSGP